MKLLPAIKPGLAWDGKKRKPVIVVSLRERVRFVYENDRPGELRRAILWTMRLRRSM